MSPAEIDQMIGSLRDRAGDKLCLDAADIIEEMVQPSTASTVEPVAIRILTERHKKLAENADNPKFTEQQRETWAELANEKLDDIRAIRAAASPPQSDAMTAAPTSVAVESLKEALRLDRDTAPLYGEGELREAATNLVNVMTAEPATGIFSSLTPDQKAEALAYRGDETIGDAALSSAPVAGAVTEEIVTAAMRAFEPYAGRLLRYPEAERWHMNDVQGMREALRTAFALARHDGQSGGTRS